MGSPDTLEKMERHLESIEHEGSSPQRNHEAETGEAKRLFNLIKDQKITFTVNQRDPYLKRAALKKGWIEIHNNSGFHFTVKWDYTDSMSQNIYGLMKSDQFYNHFPGSRELTTKQGLNTHMNAISTIGEDVSSFYPRGYDLSENRQVDMFLEDCNRTAVLNCLKKHAMYFKKMCGPELKEIEDYDLKVDNDRGQHNAYNHELKRKLKRKFVGYFPPSEKVPVVNTILLRIAVFFAHNLLLLNQTGDGHEFVKHNFYKCSYNFPPKLLHKVVTYSKVKFPILDFKTAVPNENDLKSFRGWEQPNYYVMYMAYKTHKAMKRYYP